MSFCKRLKILISNKLHFAFVLSSSVQVLLKLLKYLFICICCIMQGGSRLPCLLHSRSHVCPTVIMTMNYEIRLQVLGFSA